MERAKKRIGEIVEVSTTKFTAQSKIGKDGYTRPGFGSFIKAQMEHTSIYGLVYGVYETNIEPNRRVSTFGLERDELFKQHPYFPEFMRVEFTAAIIGYGQHDIIHTYLPPFPPRIHDFVFPCAKEEILGLTEDLDFIRSINFIAEIPIEELIATAIQLAYIERDNDQGFLIRAGREVARQFKNEYDRADRIIRRISNVG